MNPAIVIAGIYIAVRVVSFISNELREDEIERQNDIRANLDRYNQEIIRYKQEKMAQAEEEAQKEISRIRVERQKYLLDRLEERVQEYLTMKEDIQEAFTAVSSALRSKDHVYTPLRYNSLQLLRRQLAEAREKCRGYAQYLKDYKKALSRTGAAMEDVPPFEMSLPPRYPYTGRVIQVELPKDGQNIVSFRVQDLIPVSVAVDDISAFEDLVYDSVPVMIDRFGVNDDWVYHASLGKGFFQTEELQNTHLGTMAVVTKYLENAVILTYRDSLRLYLPKGNLIKPHRFPPMGSELCVYPTRWEYGLPTREDPDSCPVTVSERQNDAASSLSFQHFPVCFTQEALQTFVLHVTKNRLADSTEEWLLGPADEEDYVPHAGMKLKLQLGSTPLCFWELCEDPCGGQSNAYRYRLFFSGLCGKDESSFSADDIFVPFEVSIMPYVVGTPEDTVAHCAGIDDPNDVSCFLWDIFEEFRVQHHIKEERTGLSYFLKWESITNQLVEYLTQGDSVALQVKWDSFQRKNSIFASVQNEDELNQFLQSFSEKRRMLDHYEWRPQFFVRGGDQQKYDARPMDAGSRLNVTGRGVANQFRQEDTTLELYVQNIPYAECQQRAALQHFRSGQIVSAAIQSACLNGASIQAAPMEGAQLRPFHNRDLEGNAAQCAAVRQAFLEKNFYLIQGPPGTGKTTVIRELVEQVFENDPAANVLIVSQANVAVDNALSGGLLNKYRDEIVRCGNADKIIADLQNVTLETRCHDYLAALEARKDQFPPEYYEEWLDLVAPRRSDGISATLCEVIIRSHRLIGATCVGIAKRRAGLERAQFDLVIVDEAGKALPAEILIPLLRAKKAILIGDHKQLPPVINPVLFDPEKIDLEEREISVNQLFHHSFFERLYNSAPDGCKTMLDVQFRMPAVIGTAISRLFYDGKLKNGAGTERRKPLFTKNNLTFYNFDEQKEYQEETDGGQVINRCEAQAAVALVQAIRAKVPDCKIAIITPYKGQKRQISNTLIQMGIHYKVENIAVDTIDAFQGSEAEIVIFCTTRAQRPTLFFKDTRRINVALSRARNDLIILGRLSYFLKKYRKKDSCLPALARYIQQYGDVIPAKGLVPPKRRRAAAASTANCIVSLSQIDIPSRFYKSEPDQEIIKQKTAEYYQRGDFSTPIEVSRSGDGYTLVRGYEQFLAAQDLAVQECWVRII